MNVIIAGNSRLSDGQTVSGTEPNPEIFRFNAPLPRSLPMRLAISNPRLHAGGCAPLDSLSSLVYSRGTYPQTAFSYESDLTHIVHGVYCVMASLFRILGHTYVTEETRKYLRGHKKLKRHYLLKSWANFRLGKNRQAYGENVAVAENQHMYMQSHR